MALLPRPAMIAKACLLVLVALVAADEEDFMQTGRWPKPPDTRPAGCKKKSYSNDDFKNLTVSIILPWHKEKWEHLYGTVRSILHYTPDELIDDIIFVSDANEDSRERELKELTPKTKVISTAQRAGLIQAKSMGVDLATAPVIVFMEAHCIVNRDWLQPLLERVKLHPKILAMPMIDSIPQDNWYGYHPMAVGHWRYEWNLNLIYSNPGLVQKDPTKPYMSPGTSGGLFAMRKDWFRDLGLFDAGMLEWGGDHIELTMKVWRCGGRIEMVPCSRMGHLYRDPEHRPYPVEVNQVVKNYARIARIWLTDHLEIFYSMKPEAVNMPTPDLNDQQALFDRLKCRNMQWYLDNIDHEMKWEADKVCHPYVAKTNPLKCKGKLGSGRWTIEESNMMSRKQFLQAKMDAKKRSDAARAAKAGNVDASKAEL